MASRRSAVPCRRLLEDPRGGSFLLMWRLVASVLLGVATLGVVAVPALASDVDVGEAVDRYVADASPASEAALVGGAGSAGYDDGFFFRGGAYTLRVGATLQARFEAFDWLDREPGEGTSPGAGDLSGFSLPRATLKLSGEAPCCVSWFMALEFGHHGRRAVREEAALSDGVVRRLVDQGRQRLAFEPLREAWIQSRLGAAHVRFGLVQTPGPRQLMVAPERQQFVDVSLASAFVGLGMPGYTDRNRDMGLLLHGEVGALRWMASVTNGDSGDGVRTVLDHTTADTLAFGARVDYRLAGSPIGFEEGRLGARSCELDAELGAWGFAFADRTDRPHTTRRDVWRIGLDGAFGYGPWSLTGGFTYGRDDDIQGSGDDIECSAWLVQGGYHVPGSPWEVVGRFSGYDVRPERGIPAGVNPFGDGHVLEFAAGLNYYLNGHRNKLQLDVAYIAGQDIEDQGLGDFFSSTLIWDAYAGLPGRMFREEDGLLVRFQWQLAL